MPMRELIFGAGNPILADLIVIGVCLSPGGQTMVAICNKADARISPHKLSKRVVASIRNRAIFVRQFSHQRRQMIAVISLAFVGLNVISIDRVTADSHDWKCAFQHEVRNWSAPSQFTSSTKDISSIDNWNPSTHFWYGERDDVNTSVSGGKSGKSLKSLSGPGGKGGKSDGKASGGKSSKSALVSSSGGSAGSGGSLWTGGRRLGISWTAPIEVLESPDIVWVGSSSVGLPQQRGGKIGTNSKSSKSSNGKTTKNDVRIGVPSNRYSVRSWSSSPWRSPAPTICASTITESTEPSSSPPSFTISTAPTEYPTELTTAEPSHSPITSELATAEPTNVPTGAPSPSTEEPTTPELITYSPSAAPSTEAPTTIEPTSEEPSHSPSASPSTNTPTTAKPTNSPSPAPSTEAPTTAEPTNAPSAAPSTNAPTTAKPTNSPSPAPSTESPTTAEPTNAPSAAPSTNAPTTAKPTSSPSAGPSTEAPTTLQPSSTEPTTSEPTSSEPTSSNPTTPTPTRAELLTMVPTTYLPSTFEPETAEPTTIEPTTNAPTQTSSEVVLTLTPTFGSTPTISKETTGPPTIIPRESNRRTHTTDRKQIVSNDFKDFTYTQEVNADCVEHYDKVWNTKSDSVVEVCVYVCTVTTTILEGDELFDSNIQKTHSECPNPSA